MHFAAAKTQVQMLCCRDPPATTVGRTVIVAVLLCSESTKSVDRAVTVGPQEATAPVPDDDRPGVHLGLPLVSGLASIRDQHATSAATAATSALVVAGSGRSELVRWG